MILLQQTSLPNSLPAHEMSKLFSSDENEDAWNDQQQAKFVEIEGLYR